MKYKRLITLVLIFTIMLNFAFVPRSEASAIALEGGKAVLLLLLGALGITVATQTDLEGLYGSMDWDSMIVANHINIGDYEKPPNEPPNYDKLLKAIVAGGTAAAIGLSGILGDIKDWFKGLGVTEGENSIISNDYHYNVGDFNIVFGWEHIYSTYSEKYNIRLYYIYDGIRTNLDTTGHPDGDLGNLYYRDFDYSLDSTKTRITIRYKYQVVLPNGNLSSISEDTLYKYKSSGWNVGEEKIFNNSINYYINYNSSVITDNPPITMPQLDLGLLPNLQEVITPEGEKKLIYPGTMDDLFTDLKNITTFEDLIGSINNYQSGNSTPYTLIETEQGVEIDFGTITETPFPDIDTDPIEDTNQFQGENIGLLKSIVNWLSNILESIKNLPNNLIDTITGLFLPEDNYIGGKMDNINTIINSKLGQSDGTPLLGAFSLIDCEYIENQKGSVSLPGGISQEVDLVNTDRVNSMSETIREWQRFLWWVTIVLISMNNIYKLVRGTDLITIKGPEGTGWGSAGRKSRGGG